MDDGIPFPVKLITCGLPQALSVIVTVPNRGPKTVGVEVIERVQTAPGRTLEPQSLVTAKSPVAVMLESPRVASPLLVSLTVMGELVVVMPWPGKTMFD